MTETYEIEYEFCDGSGDVIYHDFDHEPMIHEAKQFVADEFDVPLSEIYRVEVRASIESEIYDAMVDVWQQTGDAAMGDYYNAVLEVLRRRGLIP